MAGKKTSEGVAAEEETKSLEVDGRTVELTENGDGTYSVSSGDFVPALVEDDSGLGVQSWTCDCVEFRHRESSSFKCIHMRAVEKHTGEILQTDMGDFHVEESKGVELIMGLEQPQDVVGGQAGQVIQDRPEDMSSYEETMLAKIKQELPEQLLISKNGFTTFEWHTIADILDTLFGLEWSFTVGTPVVNGDWVYTSGVLKIHQFNIERGNVGSCAITDRNVEMAIKGAASDTLKRCAIMLGIGRYLYKSSAKPDTDYVGMDQRQPMHPADYDQRPPAEQPYRPDTSYLGNTRSNQYNDSVQRGSGYNRGRGGYSGGGRQGYNRGGGGGGRGGPSEKQLNFIQTLAQERGLSPNEAFSQAGVPPYDPTKTTVKEASNVIEYLQTLPPGDAPYDPQTGGFGR